MNIELVDRYLNYQQMKLMTISLILLPDSRNIALREDSLNAYVCTFIRCYYLKELLTMDAKNVEDYDFNVVAKELEGLRFELLEDLESSDILDDSTTYQKNILLINTCKKVVLIAIELVFLDYVNCNKKDDFILVIKNLLLNRDILVDEEVQIGQLASLMKDYMTRETKFFRGIDDESFYLQYFSYLDHDEKYFLELNYKIPKLSRSYRVTSVLKTYNSDKMELNKFNSLISMFLFDIVKKINYKEDLATYFILVPDICFDKKEIWLKLVRKMAIKYIKDHVVFLLDFKTYQSHRAMLKKYEGEFQFGVMVDLTYVTDVQKKLESLEDIILFSYIIIEKVKDRDYDFVKKYEVVPTKCLMFQDFKEE